MGKLKIRSKISIGFCCLFVLLLCIAVTSVSFSVYTSKNIEKMELFSVLEGNSNELMDILNETRITAGVFYSTHSPQSYGDLSKQLMYCDLKLEKLYEYIDANPELMEYRGDIQDYEQLYVYWRDMLRRTGEGYAVEETFSQSPQETFTAFSEDMRRSNLRAHEILSRTIDRIGDASAKVTRDTKQSGFYALVIAVSISAVALFAAIAFSVYLVRSITRPIGSMQNILVQIGRYGDLQTNADVQKELEHIAAGKDEIAQCTSALLVLVDRLHEVDISLSRVADGDLRTAPALQSQQDTIGMAVVKMLNNLNQKFSTIASSTQQVTGIAKDLSDDSQLLSSGSREQAGSMGNLSDLVVQVREKTEKNTSLAREAAQFTSSVRAKARAGSEKMSHMMQATVDINQASQSITKVMKAIDDLAFQTNILALNAAVEAARAGVHGKGFAVVADEVRNLANKSALAAKESGVLIADTTQKAALGASIAEETAKALQEIVSGVENSSSIMGDISLLSQEQSADMMQIASVVKEVEQIVEQNNAIASRSASGASNISSQSVFLHELVAQFRLAASAGTPDAKYPGKEEMPHDFT